MFFGATGAVYAWDRVGEMISFIARTTLSLPLLRYVDDYFGVEHPALAEHAAHCFEELTACLLGDGTVAPDKLAFGNPLDILGVHCESSDEGFSARPSDAKVNKWAADINFALCIELLHPGNASKMAGRLSFSSTHTFRKHGRAMLRPIYLHSHGRTSTMSPELKLTLKWWREALFACWVECRAWCESVRQRVFLFADARGNPPHIAAVLICAEGCFYTDLAPDHELLSIFKKRNDAQIQGLEILAIALGLCTFDGLLRNRHIQIYSDNRGSERAAREGTSRQFDHSCLPHSFWTKLLEIHASAFVQRVATDDNVADLPSRLDFRLLNAMKAVFVEPVLDSRFRQPMAWESLSLQSVL